MAETPKHATHEGTEAAGGHASGGLPQFDPQWWPGQIIWLLIIFVALYVVLSKALLPKVGKAIDERAGRIEGDIAEARRMKDEAEAQAQAAASEMAEARARSQKLAADAKAHAAAETAKRQAKEEAVLHEKLSAAETRIKAARDEAMGNVRSIAVETAQAITERLTGQAATAAQAQAAAAKLA